MTSPDAPAAVPSRRYKNLVLEVPSFEVGPEGVPIFYGTEESPVVIRGRVIFHTQHECKGSCVLVLFSAVETVEWRVSSGNMDRVYRNRQEFKVQEFKLRLPHLPVTEKVDPSSGKTITVGAKNRVIPGTYSLDFTLPIDSHFPSSCVGYCGKMVYQLQANLIRDFPSSDVVCKQHLWVLNSQLPAPTIPTEPSPRPLAWRVYSGIFEGDVTYRCYLPNYPICLGYPFPLWLRFESIDDLEEVIRGTSVDISGTSTSDQQPHNSPKRRPNKAGSTAGRPFKVPKGIATVQERRWYLSANGDHHYTARKLYKVDLIEEQDQHPYPSRDGGDNVQNKDKRKGDGEDGLIRTRSSRKARRKLDNLDPSTRWSKMIMMQMPNVWAINPDSRTALITTQHVLSVKLDIRYGFLNTHSLTFDGNTESESRADIILEVFGVTPFYQQKLTKKSFIVNCSPVGYSSAPSSFLSIEST